jgi:Zn-dependent peptidase ImmA (M78 family)/DNA-binding XRE family transcriptional regulator
MTGPNAHINHEMLIWARKTVKLSIELAAKKIGVKPERLTTWEKGESYPTIKQLYKIANVYKRPFALFYFSAPPKHFKPLKDFRKFDNRYILTENEEYILQKELLLFQQKRQIALDLYEQLDTKVIEFELKGSLEEAPAVIGRKIREYLGIDHNEVAELKPGYDALNYWKKLLESKGILVFQTSGVPLHIMRGACIARDVLPVIIINSNDTTNGRVFSLFHELVHIVLRADGISNFRYSNRKRYDQIEVYCNQVAADVLVPSQYLTKSLVVRAHESKETVWSDDELRKLAQTFCVSREVILRRLLTLGRTSNEFYLDFRGNRIYEKTKPSSGGNYYRNQIAKNGGLFLNLVLQGYYQEKLTAASFWDYTKIKASNLAKLEQLLYAKV